jgi:chloramphenicol-sensitive protein RarD
MSLLQPNERTPEAVRVGLIAATSAHAFWGFMPLYIHALAFADALEVLAQRILWSAPAAATVILLLDGWRKGAADLHAALQPKILGPLTLSAVFVAGNWGLYIWAVDHGQVLAAALAYFLSPIVQMLAGVVFFGERLRRWQAAALALTALGVLGQAIAIGAPPWLSLVLCLTWVGYGLVRKQAAVPATAGFLLETLVLAPPALGALYYVSQHAHLAFTQNLGAAALLAMAGPITALPLILFSVAVRRIRLTTLGVLQYITPSMQFLFGVLLGEPVTTMRWASFALIWVALIVFSWDSLAADRAAKRTSPRVAPQSP